MSRTACVYGMHVFVYNLIHPSESAYQIQSLDLEENGKVEHSKFSSYICFDNDWCLASLAL